MPKADKKQPKPSEANDLEAQYAMLMGLSRDMEFVSDEAPRKTQAQPSRTFTTYGAYEDPISN